MLPDDVIPCTIGSLQFALTQHMGKRTLLCGDPSVWHQTLSTPVTPQDLATLAVWVATQAMAARKEA